MWSVSENNQKCASFAWFQQNIVSLWSGVSFDWLISVLHFLLSCFSVHMCCIVKAASQPSHLVSVHDGGGRGSLLPICFVEDKHIRKSLIGQITLYYLKRSPYVKHSFFSETQKLQFSVNDINFDLQKLHKTQIFDVHVTNLIWLMKFFWTFINKVNKWCGVLERGNKLSVWWLDCRVHMELGFS